jgi:alpha-galactosidase
VHVRASWVCAVALLGLAGFAGVAPVARAELNPPPGTDLLPVLGYSTWSYLRLGVSASKDEAEALALQTSGLEALGYDYFNQDDGWYVCPGRQGPSVDRYGRWVTDAALFPPGPGGENGIGALAAYVHGLGLRFGIYVTPGISKQAVAQNTPIVGTGYTADQIATSSRENNYNCGGMVGLDYAQPGAQAFVDSIVDEFASWGVDYIKLDGISDRNALR